MLVPGAVVVGSFMVALLTGPGAVWVDDSAGYKNRLIDHDWSAVAAAFSGASERQLPVVVLYEALGNWSLIAGVQIILLVAASLYASYAMFAVPVRFFWQFGAATITAIVLTTPFAMGFAWMLLSEALALAVVLFGVGAFLYLSARRRPLHLVVLVAAGLLATLMRPQLLLLWAPLLAIALLLEGSARRSRSAWAWTAGSVVLIGAVGWLWWSANNDHLRVSSAIRQNLNHSSVITLHATSGLSPTADELWDALRRDNPPPSCFPLKGPGPSEVLELWTEVAPAISECPEAERWAEAFPRWYAGYLARDPGMLWRYSRWAVPRALSQPWSIPMVASVPRPVSALVVGTESQAYVGVNATPGARVDTRVFFDPALLVLIAIPVALIAIRLMTGQASQLVWWAWSCWALALCALLGLLYAAVANPNTLLEMARVGAPSATAFRLLLIASLVTTLSAVVTGRGSTATRDSGRPGI